MNNHALYKKLRKPAILTGILVIASLVLAACQSATAYPQAAPAPTGTTAPTSAPTEMVSSVATSPSTPAAEAVVALATDPKLGQILVDGKGMTLYIYTKDSADTSTCTGGCAQAWPPLVTMGNPTAGAGVDQSMLGSAKLADGSLIVTYNHMPLYYFAKDAKAGDTTGQGVGGVWFVLGPDGKQITMVEPTAAAAVSASGAVINVATDPQLGKILVDGKGMTLYIYTKDNADTSTCTGGCAKAWPPFITQGTPTPGSGIDASKIGTAKLADGSMIVTYNHMPLYYWASDTKPGDTTGQGVGSVWYVVAPDGTMVKSAPPKSTY